MGRITNRQEIIDALAARDGLRCTFPDCTLPFDNGRHSVTIDHIYPQSRARAEGWSEDQINDLSNLQLQGKNCNARKGHLIPDEHGNLPLKAREPKALPKSERPAVCETCYSGRLLLPGEECYDCGGGPQPAVAPRATQKTPKECSHAGQDHCWMCYLGFVERSSALSNLVTGT